MLGNRPLTRYSAFGIHLLASAGIFLALLGLIILFWYPGPLFEIEGGWQGLRLVALVDVVLGPLLTLVVYKPGKPRLKMDMAIIIALQLAALGYGVWTVQTSRPLLLVFADDMIKPLPRVVLEEAGAPADLAGRFGPERPPRVAVRLPADPVESNDHVLELLKAGRNIHLQVQDYVPLKDAWPAVVDDSLDIAHYVQQEAVWQAALDRLLGRLGRPADQLVFLPVKGRYESAIYVADLASGDFLDYLDIPYEPALARKKRLFRDRLKDLYKAD